MKMKFTVEQYERDCLKHEVPLNTYGAEWYKVIDGWEFEFEGDSRTAYKNGFSVSKDWCVPVEEKTAREMFEALGYECDDGEYLIDYYLEISSAYGEEARKHLYFSKTRKVLETYDSSIEDCVAVDRDLLNAIVKQFEELGW